MLLLCLLPLLLMMFRCRGWHIRERGDDAAVDTNERHWGCHRITLRALKYRREERYSCHVDGYAS